MQRQNLFSPVIPSQVLTVGENTLANAPLSTILSTDGDGDGFASFEITDTEMSNLFFVEPTTGLIRLRRGGVLDFETVRAI